MKPLTNISQKSSSPNPTSSEVMPLPGPENLRETLKRKNLITDTEIEIESEIIKFRSSPEYSGYTYLIFPDDRFKPIWDLFVISLIIYTMTIYIYRVAIEDEDSSAWVIFEYIVDFVFFIDCVMVFFTCYYEGSELVTKRGKIAMRYIKSWLIIDILGFFPYEIFSNPQVGVSNPFSISLQPFYRFLRLLKLLRVLKIWSESAKIQEIQDFLHYFHIKLTRMHYLCCLFLLFCHICCCFWLILPRAYSGYDNWERYYKIQDGTNFQLYLASLYWIITTVCTIGYGDIVADNDLEKAVAICVMSGGVFFYSYTISSITSMMAANSYENSKIQEFSSLLQGIATEFKLSKNFHKRLQDAVVYNLKEKRMDFQTVLNSLPPKVASKLKFQMNSKLLKNNEFFKDKPPHFVQRILEHLNPYKAETGEYIYKEGAPCDEIYFILSGEIVFIYENNIIYESIGAGGYFGDAEIFLCEERETTAKALKKTKMLTLDREMLLSVLKDYEKLKVDMIIMSMIKRKQLKKTSVMSDSIDTSQDIHISPLQFSLPSDVGSSEEISAKFIEDCSSSLEPKMAWE